MPRLWRHLLKLSLAEWRHHPWRHGVALLAVALGVALASSVQMINASALAEFAQAVRSVNGQPDATAAATGPDGLDDALHARLVLDAAVATASPVLELDTRGWRDGAGEAAAAPVAPEPALRQRGIALRLVGVDPLSIASVAPDLLPRSDASRPDGGRADFLAPDAAWLNPAALQALGLRAGDVLVLPSSGGERRFTVAGSVAAAGRPLAVVDIAAAQAGFGRVGRLTRIDLRLQPGTDAAAWTAATALPPGVRWATADDAVQRVSNLSRAYRVNLGVLALVALLVGGFLVWSVVALSVAQRTPAFALLGVLGLAARDRRWMVLGESAVVGLLGSALGLAAGAGLAALALRLLGGDLGGGYFGGGAPALAWPPVALTACFALGTAAAVAGAWFPARQAEALAPAQALKGLGAQAGGRAPVWPGLGLLAAGGALALLPPVGGLALAAYAAVAALLAGGVVLVPATVQALLARQGRSASPVLLLALRRARFARQTASATVAGVVASLALSVAITVMVASFRDAVSTWLDSALPADLYARAAGGGGDPLALPPALLQQAAALPGVARVVATRQQPLVLDPRQPALTLLARPVEPDGRSLPLLGAVAPLPAGATGIWVSEPASAIHGWQPGQAITLPLPGAPDARFVVRGIWRDYARQFGAVAIDAGGRPAADRRHPDQRPGAVAGARRRTGGGGSGAAPGAGPGAAAGDRQHRPACAQLSLRIFDRSFAVTVYLQAVAIGVGLVGVAASLSAQVLARRKEFGLLAHLGFTQRQVIALVSAEAAAWLAGRRADRPGPGPGDGGGAGARGEPAELPLDDAAGGGPPAGWLLLVARCWPPVWPPRCGAPAAPPGARRCWRSRKTGMAPGRCTRCAATCSACWPPPRCPRAHSLPPTRAMPRTASPAAARWPFRATTARIRRRASSGGTPPAGWRATTGRPRPARLPADLLPQPHRAGGRPARPLRAAPAAVRPCRADRRGRRPPLACAAHRPLVRRRGPARGPCRARRHPRRPRPLDLRPRCGQRRLHRRPARARGRHRPGPATGAHAAAAAAGRRRLLAQGPAGAPGQPLLQPAAAGGRRHGAARRRGACAAAAGSTTSGATSCWRRRRWAGTGSAST
jgi:putative ABC transport system permease protein